MPTRQCSLQAGGCSRLYCANRSNSFSWEDGCVVFSSDVQVWETGRSGTAQTLPCSRWNSHVVHTGFLDVRVLNVLKGSPLGAAWTLVSSLCLWPGRLSQDYALMPSPGRLSLCLPLPHCPCPLCLALSSAAVFVTAWKPMVLQVALCGHGGGSERMSQARGHGAEPCWGCCRAQAQGLHLRRGCALRWAWLLGSEGVRECGTPGSSWETPGRCGQHKGRSQLPWRQGRGLGSCHGISWPVLLQGEAAPEGSPRAAQ